MIELITLSEPEAKRYRVIKGTIVRKICDIMLNELAGMFRVGSYGVVEWACN